MDGAEKENYKQARVDSTEQQPTTTTVTVKHSNEEQRNDIDKLYRRGKKKVCVCVGVVQSNRRIIKKERRDIIEPTLLN